MYFWKVKKLREDLVTNSISEKQKMSYLLASMIMYAITGQLGSDSTGVFLFIETIFIVAATTIGIIYCYKANLFGDGKDFITRFICISWPVTIRLIVAILVFTISIIIFIPVDLEKEPTVMEKIISILLIISLEAVYFWRIHVHLRYVSINYGK